MKENFFYKEFWTNAIDLMELGGHISVTFQLARFWFILVTLVIWQCADI